MRSRLSLVLALVVPSCGGDPVPASSPPRPPAVIAVAPDAGSAPIRLKKKGPTLVVGASRTWVALASGHVASWGSFEDEKVKRVETRPRLLSGVDEIVGIGLDATRMSDPPGIRACFFHGTNECNVKTLSYEIAALGPSRLIAASIDETTACIVTEAGLVRCKGEIASELAPRDHKGIRDFGTIPDVIELAVGNRHACALQAKGDLSCWGHIGPGLLGDGRTWERPRGELRGIADATRIVLGDDGGCVLRKSGRVACWGSNRTGRLGVAGIDGRATPADVSGVESATRLVVNGQCVIRDGGKLQCWGLRKGRPDPFFVDVTDAIDAALTDRGLCVVRRAGSTECHDVEGKKPKSAISRAAGATAIAAGYGTAQPVTCVLLAGARVRCWGDERYASVTMSVPKDAVGVQAGGLSLWGGDFQEPYVMVRTTSGKLLSSGFGVYYRVSASEPEQKPNPNAGLAAAETSWNEETGVAKHFGGHTLALDGKLLERETGTAIEGITDGVDFDVVDRGASTCVVHKTGAVTCWGREDGASLGRGEAAYAAKPVKVVLPEPPLL